MRILISATNLRPPSIGGGETFVSGFASALAAHTEHEIGLLVPANVSDRLRSGVDPRVAMIPTRASSGSIRVLADACLLWWRANRWAADVVIYPHEWKPFTRRPVVLVAQNIQWMHPTTAGATGVRGALLRLLVRTTSSSADAWVAVSPEAAAVWGACGGPSPTTTVVLPEGIDLPRMDAPERTSRVAVVAVTGDLPYKGLDLIESSIDRVGRARTDYVVDVVGVDRPSRAGRRYHGRLERARLLEMMGRAEVVVFPSSVESFGLPAFEALALGRPCVVREGSAMHHWLGNRVVTFDGSVEGLSDVLLSRNWAGLHVPDERFLWPNVIGGWAALIEMVGSGARRPSGAQPPHDGTPRAS